MIMDLNTYFIDYFNKTDEEKDDLLSELSESYISACYDMGMDTTDILVHADELVEGYVFQEKYEQAEAFTKIKEAIIEVIKDGRM